METILYLAHTEEDGSLSKAALEVVSAAKDLASGLSGSLAIGLVGRDVQAAADALAGCGAATIYGASGEAFAVSRYSTDVAALQALCQAAKPTLVISVADSRLSRAMPGVAQRLGGRIDTHLTGLSVKDGQPLATRWYYRQRMVADFNRPQRPWFLTVDAGCFAAYAGAPGQAQVQAVTPVLPVERTKVLGIQSPAADQQTIRPDAQVLFVTGAGWTKKQADGATHVPEAAALILGFLNGTKASLGSSKSLVDMGGEGESVLPFLTHLHQVGQTGSTPRHPKGLATCCHGEEPHVVGWRFITERRAVNLDAGCGWARGKADVLYVTDAFALMKRVNELLG